MLEWVMFTAYGVVGTGQTEPSGVSASSAEEPYPKLELTDGVADIRVHASGDVPTEAFLAVVATSEEKAVEVWKHVAEHSAMTIAGWWSGTAGKQPDETRT